MVCVVITRGGAGDAWLAESLAEASLHPIMQYGDAVISCREDVLREYNLLDLDTLLRVIGDDDLRSRVLGGLPQRGETTERRRMSLVGEHAQDVFDRLVSVATPLPEDPSEICRIVRQDRITRVKEGHMAETKTQTAAPKTPAPKAEKAPKPPKYDPKSKIQMLADKDGNAYGPKNNPKRAGSKAFDKFALYKDGMTIAKATEAGITSADLDYDTKHDFIKVVAA